jgi:IS5 family transposase
MIREISPKQVPFSEFDWPFQNGLDVENRWVKMAQCIPWEALCEAYHANMNEHTGRPALKARIVIGALIIKHKLVLSDRETVGQIQENPYMQYFIGLDSYTCKKPFDASLFVSIRRRMGQEVFDQFSESIIDELSQIKSGRAAKRNHDSDDNPPTDSDTTKAPTDSNVESSAEDTAPTEQTRRGRLLIDATVVDQAIRFPTDISLLNEAREFSEQIIDYLYRGAPINRKPRTYRQNARRDYLGFAKRRKPTKKAIRKARKQQLQYLKRNLSHIDSLLTHYEQGCSLPLPSWLLRRYWVIPHLYEQQKQMHDMKVNRCDNRIVSIHQPWVRPIVRGKQHKPTEFGAKINVGMDGEGIATVDYFSWNAFNEGNDLPEQVEAYKTRHGYYPEVVLADPIYGTRANRTYLKNKEIRFAGKPLGRPKKVTAENAEQLKAEKKQRHTDYRERIPIEGKFGQGKSGYRLNYNRAKRSDTSQAWTNSIFFVMNLLVLYELFFWPFFSRCQRAFSRWKELLQQQSALMEVPTQPATGLFTILTPSSV